MFPAITLTVTILKFIFTGFLTLLGGGFGVYLVMFYFLRMVQSFLKNCKSFSMTFCVGSLGRALPFTWSLFWAWVSLLGPFRSIWRFILGYVPLFSQKWSKWRKWAKNRAYWIYWKIWWPIFLNWLFIKIYIISYVPAQIQYLGKISFLRYGPKCYRSIRFKSTIYI